MSEFTMDNTEGYTESELAELNRRFDHAAHDVQDLDERQRIAERVLAEFDTENSPE